MGSDVTASALKHQIPRFKAIGKAQLDALEAGQDPKDVNVGVSRGNQGQKFDNFSLIISFLYLTSPALFETLLMLRQPFPNTLEKTALLVALASSSAKSSNMPRVRSNTLIQAETLRLLALVLVKAKTSMARVAQKVLS
jgi:hypothetical protein